MRRIGIFLLLAFMTLGFSQTFGYLEDKVYCDIDGKNVTIFLQAGNGLKKCQVYVDALYQMALQRYNEILLIRDYISQGEDLYYRKRILENKNSEFLQFVSYRTQIKTAMDKFETSLFNQYYSILKREMEDYYEELQLKYNKLVNDSYRNTLSFAQLEQQMWNVSHMIEAKNLNDIMNVMSSYIYLKQQLRGR